MWIELEIPRLGCKDCGAVRQAEATIEAVAIDVSQACIHAVKEDLPDAVLVFDHFRVVHLMNEKLANLRRELRRQAYGYRDQEFLRLRLFALHETRRVPVG